MAKGKRKRDDDGLDFGTTQGDEEESTEGEETQEEENELLEIIEGAGEEPPKRANTDLNRIIEEDEEIRFSGKVSPEDIPQCPCCGAEWSIRENTFIAPGCGCSIHPICPQCSKCEAHCTKHYAKVR